MKKNLKGLISLFISIMLIFSIAVPSFASKNDGKINKGRIISSIAKNFKDVKEGHWAYDYIMWMYENNIIDGVGNDSFNPNGTVTRAQFAKMMVNTLDLKLYSPDTPTFADVAKKAWEYKFVESSKNYLTYYKTSSGNYFRPSENAVREDMAVALVKALGYQNEAVDESILNQFGDSSQITSSLRKYVALAVKYGLMTGDTKDGKLVFDSQGNLTRAQAATLLYRAFRVNDEKVPYEEDKLPYEESNDGYVKPVVSVTTVDNKLVVKWNKISSTKLSGYKIVISKNDSTPAYPDNGYLYYITDKNQTSAVIDNSTAYNGTSDFGSYLTKGEKYYISVTAVYTDKVIAGNAVHKTYPGAVIADPYTAPVVYTTVENGVLVLRWNKIESEKLSGYKVVVSKNDSTPVYPDNGYLYNITDKNKTSAIIDNSTAYNGTSDFGNYLTKGEKYYFSVTAVYTDKNVAGNVIQAQYNGIENPELYVMPIVTAAEENGKLVLRWNQINSANFVGYRVVASKNDSSPSYPENGYLYTITDKAKNFAIIDNSTAYTNSDFGGYFIKGDNYYFSVTAVYTDRSIVGNTLQLKYNGDDNPALFPAPVVSADYENNTLVVKWNKIDSAQLVEYRVVISQNNANPAYPANGFYNTALDKNATSAAIDVTKPYTGGDFTTLTYGNEYYFSVTAVYANDKYVAGNAVKKLYLIAPNP